MALSWFLNHNIERVSAFSYLSIYPTFFGVLTIVDAVSELRLNGLKFILRISKNFLSSLRLSKVLHFIASECGFLIKSFRGSIIVLESILNDHFIDDFFLVRYT